MVVSRIFRTILKRRLRLSSKTVRRLIKAGKLRAYQIERQWRVAERDLLQFLNARCND